MERDTIDGGVLAGVIGSQRRWRRRRGVVEGDEGDGSGDQVGAQPGREAGEIGRAHV